MKKHLLIAGLVLTIATSVISGTMAAYSKEIILDEANIAAKHFVLEANRTDDKTQKFRIAPGEEVKIPFKISNGTEGHVTEVPMNIAISIAVGTGADENSPLTYKLYSGSDTSANAIAEVVDGVITYNGLKFDVKASTQTESFTLVANWPLGAYDDTDIAYEHNNFGTAKITVSGFQADSDGNFVATAP